MSKARITKKQIAVRFVVGVLLFLMGVVLTVLYFTKANIFPGWETNKLLGAFMFVWAYAGFFVGPALTVSGLCVAYVPEIIYIILKEREKKNG